jgi:hypothetical protein
MIFRGAVIVAIDRTSRTHRTLRMTEHVAIFKIHIHKLYNILIRKAARIHWIWSSVEL